jgi:histidinol-phosphate aminotransferase 1
MFSRRLKNLSPYVPGEQLTDRDYIKLNANENPYPPCPDVLNDAVSFLREHGERTALYPDPESVGLRRAIASMLNESGGVLNKAQPLPFSLTEDMIFCGNGSDEALSFIFYAFFDSDKPLFVPEYTYSFYPVYAGYYGIPLQRFALKDDWSIDADAVLSLFERPCGGFICANPNAPTGIALSIEQIEKILRAADGRFAVVIDEAYADFSEATALPLLQTYKNLIIVRTFSKSFAFAGMRLGFCVAHPDAIDALKKTKNSFNHFPVDALTQCAASSVCKNWRYYADTCSRICSDRDAFSRILQEAGWTVLPSRTNFVMVKKGGLEGKARLSGAQVYEALKTQGFLVRHFAGKATDDFVRITIGTQEQMRSLAAIMTKL